MGDPSAEAQSRLLPHAHHSDRLELPRNDQFADQSDEYIAFGFRLAQRKRWLGAGDSPNLSSGAPQGGAPRASVLRPTLLGIKIPGALLLYLSAFPILY